MDWFLYNRDLRHEIVKHCRAYLAFYKDVQEQIGT